MLNQHVYFDLFRPRLLLQFAAGFVTLLVISWQCGLAVTAAATGFALIIRFQGKKLAVKQKILQEKKAAFVDTVTELHRGYEEIHLNQMECSAETDFAEKSASVERALYNYRLHQYGIETLGIAQNMLIYLLILIVGGMAAYHGLTGLGVFIAAAELSGGEKKRLAFARALYRDGDILLLDEFTSAVHESMAEDLETEILKSDDRLVIHVTHTLIEKNMSFYDAVFSVQDKRVVCKGAGGETRCDFE